MAKRVITRKERLKRAEQRRKMLQSFYLCLFVSLILLLIYLIIFIPMATNLHDIFLNPLGDFFLGGNSFLLFFRGLVSIEIGIITLADILTALLLSCFFAFIFIGIANLLEYKRHLAGYLEMIIVTSGTLLLTIIYGYAAGSAVMTALTLLGCILTILYLYAVQT
ncbi:MAG: hypothetical protein ACTSO9_04950 [Candidatus Helarchaeota archaeon]